MSTDTETQSVQQAVDNLARALGMDPWSDRVLKVNQPARFLDDFGHAPIAEDDLPSKRVEVIEGAIEFLINGLVQMRMKAAVAAYHEAVALVLDRQFPEGSEAAEEFEGEHVPFYSEASLYEWLGKEDGRSVLYTMRAIGRALGVK